MAFHDVRFPTDLPAAAGGVRFKTAVVTTAGGYELRVAEWATPLGRWTIDSRRLDEDQAQQLIAFFRARAGRLHAFRFRDAADYQATGQFLGMGDGSTKSFALRKRYVSGTQVVDRLLRLPVAGTVKVSLDGVLQPFGVSVNTSTGLVSFLTPPPENVVVTADCDFDLAVRFDTDLQQLDWVRPHRTQWTDIALVEVR